MNEPKIPGSAALHESSAVDQDDLDQAPLARDGVLVRSLEQGDIDRIVRIDTRITGCDRRAYYERKMSEALYESGVRVSLVAEVDEQVAGFVMARVDYGDFGQAETTAIIDTIGVDPGAAGGRIGQALVSQLLINLGALRVETTRTEVQWDDFALCGFLARCGFAPAQRLAFSMPLD
jgi:predicted N-acetyltransferase YhbS